LCGLYSIYFCFYSTKRTKVIDDESDYFAADNRWLTKKQRDQVAKREQDLRDKRFASRLDKKFTIDFAGRKVIENQENNCECDAFVYFLVFLLFFRCFSLLKHNVTWCKPWRIYSILTSKF